LTEDFKIEYESKRGDAVLYKYTYLTDYYGVEDSSDKKFSTVVLAKRKGQEAAIWEWFESKYQNKLISVQETDIIG
jgi:hypothetical protein